LTAVPEDFAKIKIAPGFLLSTDVFDEPDLTSQVRVGDDGDIELPLIGAIHVAGETTSEAQRQIEQKLTSAQIMRNPQVTVNVLQYAASVVTVLGEVNTPGRLQILAPHSLLDIISFAGGETQLAGGEVLLKHNDAGNTTNTTYHYGRGTSGDDIGQVEVHNGDTVIVPRAGIVYVLGAVNRPGGYLMQEEGKLDVAQALAMAMGTTMVAKVEGLHVIRRKADGTYVEFTVSYKDMTNGKISPPKLEAQDILYVPVSKPKAILSGGTGIIGQATSATIYAVR
jgi:polysaccharide export outer membrane protein